MSVCELASRESDGLLDVGGLYVRGRPGARFRYLPGDWADSRE